MQDNIRKVISHQKIQHCRPLNFHDFVWDYTVDIKKLGGCYDFFLFSEHKDSLEYMDSN